jgi:dihydrolipoamide dehydrogenase
MRVLNRENGEVIAGMYCIGDANGKMMLAHAASAQVVNLYHLRLCGHNSKLFS